MQKIRCPQCKIVLHIPPERCWSCDMPLDEMIIKFICKECGMHFTDNYNPNGNICRRSYCGSKNLDMIFRKGWTNNEIQYLLEHLNTNPDIIAKQLPYQNTSLN